MIVNIFDYMDTIEYPSNDLLAEGIKDGISFDFVPTTYLNGFINCVQIIDAYMFRRYKVLESYLVNKYGTYDQSIIEANIDPNNLTWERSCCLIDERMEKRDFHFTHTMENFDDMLILGKLSDSYWVFWVSCQPSESCIGRLSISTFESDNDAMESLKKAAKDFSNEDSKKDIDKIKQIPIELFSDSIQL